LNCEIGLAVGEIPTLSQLSRLYSSMMRYELLSSCEIFRLQYICTPSIIYLNDETDESTNSGCCTKRLKWFQKLFIVGQTYSGEENNFDN
jgi:hypothetical protein